MNNGAAGSATTTSTTASATGLNLSNSTPSSLLKSNIMTISTVNTGIASAGQVGTPSTAKPTALIVKNSGFIATKPNQLIQVAKINIGMNWVLIV